MVILGDFPPNTYTGISLVNAGVSQVLSNSGKSILTIDESAWKAHGISRIFQYFSNYGTVFWTLLINRVKYFYVNIPLSRLGLLRLILVCSIVKLASPRVQITGHIHRGDIGVFCGSPMNRILLNFSLRYFYTVLVLSSMFASELKAIARHKRVEVVANTSFFEGNCKPYAYKYSGRFVCISNFIQSKGLGDLVEVFSLPSMCNCTLTVAGNLYDEVFFKEIRQNISSNINLIVAPSRDEVRDLLMKSDCFVFPSWNEGQPLVLLEAMSIGLPIIATSVGDIPNMLGNSYQYIVNKQSTNELYAAIKSFDENMHKDKISDYLKNRYNMLFSNELFRKTIIQIFT